jgi:hypothetical protein
MKGAGFKIERDALMTHFLERWVDDEDEELTPVSWPNMPFDPPQPDAEDEDVVQPPWARFHVVHAGADQLTGGSRKNDHRFAGIVYVSLFVGKNDNTDLLTELADAAAACFIGDDNKGIVLRDAQNNPVGNIIFRTPEIVHVGPDGAYYQLNCKVPFRRTVLL